MTDAWTDRLSEYADDSLTGEERALLDAHLGTCASCATTLTGLRAVIDRARTLPERAPDVDLWPGIEARISAFARDTHAAAERSAWPQGARGPVERARRGLVLSWPQLVAAGLTLVALSGGVSWIAGRNASRPIVATRTMTRMRSSPRRSHTNRLGPRSSSWRQSTTSLVRRHEACCCRAGVSARDIETIAGAMASPGFFLDLVDR